MTRFRRGEIWQRDGGTTWYAWHYCPDRRRWTRRSTGRTVRRAAAEVARQWVEEGERLASGLIQPADLAVGVTLEHHIKEFLEARRNAPEQVTGSHLRQTEQRLRRLLAATGWQRLDDVTADSLLAGVAKLSAASRRSGGLSNASRNAFRLAARTFTRWAHRTGRLKADPLADVRKWRTEGFRTFQRRAMTPDEFRRLVEATESAPRRAGLSGLDRAMLYRVAVGTGFRRNELASLRATSFRLAGAQPVVVLEAVAAKSRKAVEQPVGPALAGRLRRWLAGRPPTWRPWGGLPATMGTVLRADAAAAGVAARDALGARLDFHALRHTFGTWLALAGVTPQEAQRLMRHSTVDLTMRVYTHLGREDLSRAMGRAEAWREGGTEPEASSALRTPCALSCAATDHHTEPDRSTTMEAMEGTGPGNAPRPPNPPNTTHAHNGPHASGTGDPGFEPGLSGSEPLVLPLHQSPSRPGTR